MKLSTTAPVSLWHGAMSENKRRFEICLRKFLSLATALGSMWLQTVLPWTSAFLAAQGDGLADQPYKYPWGIAWIILTPLYSAIDFERFGPNRLKQPNKRKPKISLKPLPTLQSQTAHSQPPTGMQFIRPCGWTDYPCIKLVNRCSFFLYQFCS